MKLPGLFIVCLISAVPLGCDSGTNQSASKLKDAIQSGADVAARGADVAGNPGAKDTSISSQPETTTAIDTVATADTSKPDSAVVPVKDTQTPAADTAVAVKDAGGGTPQPDTTTPQPADAGKADYTLPAGLNGVPVDGKPALAEFKAVKDTKNQFVTQDIFLGHWTVLWFYPFASTPG